MRPNPGLLLLLALTAAGLLGAPAVRAETQADPKETLKKARAAYSNLRERGLLSFASKVAPNWELILKEQGGDPKTFESTVKKLQDVRFTMSYSESGAVRVTHDREPASETPQQAATFKQITGGMAQTVAGFMAVWTPFMQAPPLPEPDAAFTLEEKDDHYRLRYKEGGADVLTILGKDHAVRELTVKTDAFSSTLKPVFQKSPKGFVLVGYDAAYEGSGNSTRYQVEIENLEAEGFALPSKLKFKGLFNQNPISVEIAFSDYEVKKR